MSFNLLQRTGSEQMIIGMMLLRTILAVLCIAQPSLSIVKEWVIKIPGGSREAERVAEVHKCKNLGLLKGYNDVYVFERDIDDENEHLKFDEDNKEHVERLQRVKRDLELHPSIDWADPQVPLKRVKRDGRPSTDLEIFTDFNNDHAPSNFFKSDKALPLFWSEERKFNDELWSHQWYMQGGTMLDSAGLPQPGNLDLRIKEVWEMGYTGEGVVVTVLDDGLERNHSDIKQNYDPRASYDYNFNKQDPTPRYDLTDDNSHGTKCAGEIAMVANNKKCGVGVAPRAKVGGIKILDNLGSHSDKIESSALIHNIGYIDIYVNSWGPNDDGQSVRGPLRFASDALRMGATQGRGNKGVIYVWANGNGGARGDDCNCDGFVSSIYTFAIGSVSQQGELPRYGERCASTLAVAPSSGSYIDKGIVTTDLHNKCTTNFGGTSAAAPIAAGIFALVLQANPSLTMRDVQHLTVWTSDPISLSHNSGWKKNAAGLMFNKRFGFGLLNAKAMVEAALKWKNVPRKSICSLAPTRGLPANIRSRTVAYLQFDSDGCQRRYAAPAPLLIQSNGRTFASLFPAQTQSRQQQQQQLVQEPVIFLEHVRVIVDIEYSSRGSLEIFLMSPSGTVSTLLNRRPLDKTDEGFAKWPLMSVHFWGETSFGSWTLIVRDRLGQNNIGQVVNATLELHGTALRPMHMNQPRVYPGEERVPPFLDPVNEFDEDDIYSP